MKILKPVIAVVVLAAVAGGIWYFLNSKDAAPGARARRSGEINQRNGNR